MNEITRIHLASTPYNIEIAAKKKLEEYIRSIKLSLKADDDAIREIESRIVELLAERKITGEITITEKDVEAIEKQLGDPSDFADDEDAQEKMHTDKSFKQKRLMRDQQNAMIGGVCAGVASYFGMDVVLVRILTVVLLFVTSGAMIPIYLVMWFIMPEAKTAADRLTMTGTPITLKTLKNESALESTAPTKEKMLVKLFRLLVGVVTLILAIITMITVALGVFTVPFNIQHPVLHINNGWVLPSLFLIAFSGTLLAMLFGLFTYALFTKKFTKKMGISTIVIIVIGLVTFGVGASYAAYNVFLYDKRYSESRVKETVDVKDKLDGIDSIVVRSKNTSIDYTVADKHSGNLQYNSINTSSSNLNLTRNGKTLIVDTTFLDEANQSNALFQPTTTAKLSLSGPILRKITVESGNVSYSTLSQEALDFTLKDGSSLQLHANDGIQTLNGKIENHGYLQAQDVLITKSNLKFERGGTANFNSVDELQIDAPESCRENEKMYVNVKNRGLIFVNGTAWDKKSGQKCISIEHFQDN